MMAWALKNVTVDLTSWNTLVIYLQRFIHSSLNAFLLSRDQMHFLYMVGEIPEHYFLCGITSFFCSFTIFHIHKVDEKQKSISIYILIHWYHLKLSLQWISKLRKGQELRNLRSQCDLLFDCLFGRERQVITFKVSTSTILDQKRLIFALSVSAGNTRIE